MRGNGEPVTFVPDMLNQVQGRVIRSQVQFRAARDNKRLQSGLAGGSLGNAYQADTLGPTGSRVALSGAP